MLDDVDPDAGMRVVEQQVAALDTGHVDTIVRERFGDALSRRDMQKLHEMAGGNPMFALQITISSGTVRSMRLTSEGVFQQRGRQPSMWLKVWAELDLSDVRQLTGHGTVTVSADLNLNPAVPAA